MKKLNLTALLAALTLMVTSQVYSASDHNAHKSKGQAHQGHDMSGSKNMGAGHDNHASGMKVHESHQDGYLFEYRLINMKEKMKNMKNMPEMKDTHHLMVFVKDRHGAAVETAKVGYFVEDKQSGTVQKKMAMSMNSGFGADVTLEPGNHYRIKTKVMVGDKKLMDEFKYTGGDH